MSQEITSATSGELTPAQIELLGWRVRHGDGMTQAEREAASDIILRFAQSATGESSELERLRTFQHNVEEAEWRCCPEDMGFEEWIGILTKRLADMTDKYHAAALSNPSATGPALDYKEMYELERAARDENVKGWMERESQARNHLQQAIRFIEGTYEQATTGILQAGNDRSTAFNMDEAKALVRFTSTKGNPK